VGWLYLGGEFFLDLAVHDGGDDAAALYRRLERVGLFDRVQSLNLSAFICRFPAIVRGNIFVEYELQPAPALAGCGVGFAPGILDRYSATGHRFCESDCGREIFSLLEKDPFAHDHYLNIPADPDPDWIEYDVFRDAIGERPFVFHRFPTRYRNVSCPPHLGRLLADLPAELASEQLAAILSTAVELGPIGMYRAGFAPHRASDWCRVVVDRLNLDQIAAVLRGFGVQELPSPLEFVRDVYGCRNVRADTLFALSVDVQNGRVGRVDVECPYFPRFADPSVRRTVLDGVLALLVREGVLTESSAAWLAAQVREDANLDIPGTKLAIHHLKFRCLGSPLRRVKAYFLLGLVETTPKSRRSPC
jgi:hypothetical protein